MDPAPSCGLSEGETFSMTLAFYHGRQREETSREVSSDAQASFKNHFLGVDAAGGAG